MAHLALPIKEEGKKPFFKRLLFRLPPLVGKLGISFFIFQKEVFIGLAIGEVEIEKVIRQKRVKLGKSKVQVYRFD